MEEITIGSATTTTANTTGTGINTGTMKYQYIILAGGEKLKLTIKQCFTSDRE